MTQYTVLGRLKLMVGLDDEAAREALPLCAAAVAQLLPQVKPGRSPLDPRLDNAAACMARCMLLARGEAGEADGIESFKAGDIMVTKKDKSRAALLKAAETERTKAFEDARELLRDTGFYVREVKFKREKSH